MRRSRHIHFGRQQRGTELVIVLQSFNATESTADPDYIPTVTIYKDGSSRTLIQTVKIAADQRGVVGGFFRLPIFLGELYTSTGRYLVAMRWCTGGIAHCVTGDFYMLPGGSADGTIISMSPIERPDARYVIWQTDGGLIVRGRNPRVST